VPTFQQLLMANPASYQQAGTALRQAAEQARQAQAALEQAVGQLARSWSGSAHQAQQDRARELAHRLGQVAQDLDRAAQVVTTGGQQLQALVTQLRSTVQQATAAGFMVLPSGQALPGPTHYSQAAAAGPAAPAVLQAYQAVAQAYTAIFQTLVAQATALDASIAAQLHAGTAAAAALTAEGAPGQAGALQWSDVSDLLPTDDSGYQITPRDCEFLGITPQAVADWHARRAPLGMTPQQYGDFRDSLFAALQRDGFSPDDVDVRLQGSSAHFFSGPHKELPTAETIQDPAAAARYEQWRGDAQEHPLRRPFDSMYRLGLEPEPSDYDVQVSSDAMVARAEAVRQESFPDRELLHPKYGFVRKEIAESAFPELYANASEQGAALGRPVVPAVFPGSGPPDTSGSGRPSSHFRDTDWLIRPR
jgi:hypothetical protein